MITDDKMISIIKENDKSYLLSLLEESGKVKTLSAFAPVLDKRAYFTINESGELKRKNNNLIIPFFAYCNDNELLAENIFEKADLKERCKIGKVNRFSNVDEKKLKENLLKTLTNGGLEFSLKYGKELFLRNRDEFFKTVLLFSLMGDLKSLKPLVVLSFKKLMENQEYDENLFYLLISFLTKYRDNFYFYENAEIEEDNSFNLKEFLLANENILNSREGLGAISSLKALEELEKNYQNKFIQKIKNELITLKKVTSLNSTEKYLLSIFQ